MDSYSQTLKNPYSVVPPIQKKKKKNKIEQENGGERTYNDKLPPLPSYKPASFDPNEEPDDFQEINSFELYIRPVPETQKVIKQEQKTTPRYDIVPAIPAAFTSRTLPPLKRDEDKISINDNKPILEKSKIPQNKKSDKKSKIFLILGLVIGFLVLLVIVLLVLTIVYGVKSASNETTTTKSTTTSSSFTVKSSCQDGYTGDTCQDRCGVQYYQYKRSLDNVKISGGANAQPHSWPSVVFIKFNYKRDYTYNGSVYQYEETSFCTGTLISRDTVLTSSQCFVTKITFNIGGSPYTFSVNTNSYYPSYESMYTVYMGYNNLSDSNNGVRASIKSFILYPYYDSTNLIDDIAIIKLANKVELSTTIQLACLPDIKYSVLSTFKQAWVIGWGNNLGSYDDKLSDPMIEILSNLYCVNLKPTLTKNWYSQICAGDNNSTNGACENDVGAPLFVYGNIGGLGSYVLSGIVSYTNGCGQTATPAVYTQVYPYLTWITTYL